MTNTEEFAQRIKLLTPCELSALIARLSAISCSSGESRENSSIACASFALRSSFGVAASSLYSLPKINSSAVTFRNSAIFAIVSEDSVFFRPDFRSDIVLLLIPSARHIALTVKPDFLQAC